MGPVHSRHTKRHGWRAGPTGKSVEGIERIANASQPRFCHSRSDSKPLLKKLEGRKKMLAMKIYSDTNDGFRLSLSTILCHETIWNRRLHSNFDRFFRSALSSRDLSI